MIGTSENKLPRGIQVGAFAERAFTLLLSAVQQYGTHAPLAEFAAQGPRFPANREHHWVPDYLESHRPGLLFSEIHAHQMKVDEYRAKIDYTEHPPAGAWDEPRYNTVDVWISDTHNPLRRGRIRVHINASSRDFTGAVTEALNLRTSNSGQESGSASSAAIPLRIADSRAKSHGVNWRDKGADGVVGTASSLLANLVTAALIGG